MSAVRSVRHVVGPLAEFESGTARRVEIAGIAVAVVRIDDDVYALGDVCSHANVSLSEGEVWCDERELECPKHGSVFHLVTGVPATLPATQAVPVFDAAVIDGEIVVTVAVTSDDDVDVAGSEGVPV